MPMALATSSMEAPVSSQSADKLLMDEIRCANIAFEANLESSEDQTLVVMILSSGIHRL